MLDKKVPDWSAYVREKLQLHGFRPERESEIVEEIAQQLHITVETERTHMVNILGKLGAHSQLQALVIAVRHGIVTVE